MGKLKLLVLAMIWLIYADSFASVAEVVGRGFLKCGVAGNSVGFSWKNSLGEMSGIDAEFCRAVAASIGVEKVEFFELGSEERLKALKSGRVDLLSRNTTWTLSRDLGGIQFVGVIYYDGEALMVKKSSKYKTLAQARDARFCTLAGATTLKNLKAYYKREVETQSYPSLEQLEKAFFEDQCDVYPLDRSLLYGRRSKFSEPSEYRILDGNISKEPLAPAVTNKDEKLVDLVRWTLFALIRAEELGLTSKNINNLRDADHRSFIESSNKASDLIGVRRGWVERVIRKVGNYDEVYKKNLGSQSSLKIPRGKNNLMINGGLMYSPPFK